MPRPEVVAPLEHLGLVALKAPDGLVEVVEGKGQEDSHKAVIHPAHIHAPWIPIDQGLEIHPQYLGVEVEHVHHLHKAVGHVMAGGQDRVDGLAEGGPGDIGGVLQTEHGELAVGIGGQLLRQAGDQALGGAPCGTGEGLDGGPLVLVRGGGGEVAEGGQAGGEVLDQGVTGESGGRLLWALGPGAGSGGGGDDHDILAGKGWDSRGWGSKVRFWRVVVVRHGSQQTPTPPRGLTSESLWSSPLVRPASW